MTPRADEILKNEIHRIASAHLSHVGVAKRVCEESLSTIEHMMPIIREHENDEVRRIAAPLIAMLGMTLRNVSFSLMDRIVEPDQIRKALEAAGVMGEDDAYAIEEYRNRQHHDVWNRILSVSQRATNEADSMPEKRPETLAEDQRKVEIPQTRGVTIDSHDGVNADTLREQIADLEAVRTGDARISLGDDYGSTLVIEGRRRLVFYIRTFIGDDGDRKGAAVALALMLLKEQLRRVEAGGGPTRAELEQRLQPFVDATHAANAGRAISGERYELTMCYPTPWSKGGVTRCILDKRGSYTPGEDEQLPVAPSMMEDYASLPYGYKLSASCGWKDGLGTDTYWVDPMAHYVQTYA